MNFNHGILLFLLVLALLSSFIWSRQSKCDSWSTVNASLELIEGNRKLLGFNTDRDSLHFGKVSAGATVKKTLFVNYTVPAEVSVTAHGQLSPWLLIEPQQFKIIPLKTEEVTVQVIVPEVVIAGNYSGSIEFCFRE